MIKREIFLGFITGILSNALGMLVYILIFSQVNLIETLRQAYQSRFLGILIAAGAIFNFLPFFWFLKKDRIYRARGVLMASILSAIIIALLKIF